MPVPSTTWSGCGSYGTEKFTPIARFPFQSRTSRLGCDITMSASEGSTQPLSRPADKTPRIPDYEVLRRIGAGGYGEVFLARNSLGTYCAIKVVRRSPAEE